MTQPDPSPSRRRVLSWLPRILAGGALGATAFAATRRDSDAPAHKASCRGGGMCAYCGASESCIRPAAQSYRHKTASSEGANG